MTPSLNSPGAVAAAPPPLPAGAPAALVNAWNATMQAEIMRIAIWNQEAKTDYLAYFAGYQADVTNGRTDPAKTPPDDPPKAWMVGYYDDPTTGPGTTLGIKVYWPTPVRSNDAVCAIPPIATPPPLYNPTMPSGAVQPLANVRNAPAGTVAADVGTLSTDPDGSEWVIVSSVGFGNVTVFYQVRVR